MSVDLSRIMPAPRVPSPRAKEVIFQYQGTQKVLLVLGLVFSIISVIEIAIFLVFSTMDSIFPALVFLLQPIIFLSVGLPMLLWAVYSNNREIHAFTRGTPIAAKVIFVGHDRSVRMNRQHPILVQWEFTVADRRFTGKISSLNHDHMAPLMGQKELPVLYDPQDPTINTIYLE